jgi:hypothetical protein
MIKIPYRTDLTDLETRLEVIPTPQIDAADVKLYDGSLFDI